MAPKVTPIIVAAIPIPNNFNAEKLHPMTRKILNGLTDQKVQVISYACDGTEVEWAIQRLIIERANSTIKHVLKHPQKSGANINVVIPVIKGQLVTII